MDFEGRHKLSIVHDVVDQGRRDLEGFWGDPERLFGWAGLFMACGFSKGERYVVKMLTGFPANSVFIVDSEDRVRHHTVLDPRF